jgi:hypothetical protein
VLAAMERAMGCKAAPGPIGGPVGLHLSIPHYGPSQPAPPPVSRTAGRPGPQQPQSTNGHTYPAPPDPATVNHDALTVGPATEQSTPAATISESPPVAPSPEAAPVHSTPPEVSPQPPQTESHNGTPQNSQGHCNCCNVLLPPLLKNGERPIPDCPKCGNTLTPPPYWTFADYLRPNNAPTACDFCRQRHELDPNGLPDPCSACGLPAAEPKP